MHLLFETPAGYSLFKVSAFRFVVLMGDVLSLSCPSALQRERELIEQFCRGLKCHQ